MFSKRFKKITKDALHFILRKTERALSKYKQLCNYFASKKHKFLFRYHSFSPISKCVIYRYNFDSTYDFTVKPLSAYVSKL